LSSSSETSFNLAAAMSTLLLLRLSLAALLSLAASVSSAATRHNILFIVVDDLPVHITPLMDPTHAVKQSGIDYTPNLQKLAKESVLFHRAYVQNAA
jgi:hypothetical protein